MKSRRARHRRTESVRYTRPSDILLPPGYSIDVFAKGLTTPINMLITDDERMFVADSGIISGSGKVYRLAGRKPVLVADGFNPPLTGITYHLGDIYVAHRGAITVIKPDKTKRDILTGLPSWGDHHNNRVVFGPDGKMYFGQGTATNSGVVGLDNDWVKQHPYFHDLPGSDIELCGENYRTRNIFTRVGDHAVTGAYSPFGQPSEKGEEVSGAVKASGSILRANPDGTELELVAWGLRNPFRLRFDQDKCLYAANHGMDVRGSRPVDNSPDEFQLIEEGMWYGWPDYSGGEPVTMAKFRAEGHEQPDFLIARHPMRPPEPFACFETHAAIMGFDFNYDPFFGKVGDAYIAEFGSEAPETTGGKPAPRVGHRVTKIDMETRTLHPFAINKSGFAASYTGGGGFERPIDVVFGKGGIMYIVDFGISEEGETDKYLPGTGVIWRVKKLGRRAD